MGRISEHTNARAHCSFQLGTTTEYGSTWLSLASSTCETCTVVQTLDYFPYGGLRIESGTDVSTRKYIGERYDQNTDLNYFNARYYQSSRGQFLSQDPTFLALGNPAAVNALSKVDQSILLSDPQALNSYSYALNNPIRFKDKDGKFIDVPWISNSPWVQDAATAAYQQSPTWRFAMDHPNTTAAIVAVGSYPALASGGSAIAAFQMAGAAGVGTTFMAQQAFAGVVYSALTIGSTMAIPGLVGQFGQINPRNPSSFGPAAWSLLTGPVAARVGGYPGAFADAYQFGGLLNRTLGTAAFNLYSNSVDTRRETASSFNAQTGGGGGGGSAPSNNSLWVTPSGAVVTFGGQLVAPPPSSTK